MSWESGTASSYTDLLDKLNTFLIKGHALAPAYAGTGTGLITGLIGTSSSVQETITVTFSSDTAFSVVGSVTGSMGAGTVGSAFSHARCAFTITAGGTDWASGDTIAAVMTPPWAQMRGVAGSEYIWKAPGNANTDSIYVGAKTFCDAPTDYFNWRVGGFSGFNSGQSFTAQPGACASGVVPLWNSSIPYWFFASGKRAVVVAKISTYYEFAYLGFIDSYMSPNQFPYPLAVGASMRWYNEPASDSPSWRWSYTGPQHSACWTPNADTASIADTTCTLRLRKPDGYWRGHCKNYSYDGRVGQLWPFAVGDDPSFLKANLDGSYPLFPIVLHENNNDGTTNTFGEFSDVAMVPGAENAAENAVTIGRETWVVFHDIFRTTAASYCAIKMA